RHRASRRSGNARWSGRSLCDAPAFGSLHLTDVASASQRRMAWSERGETRARTRDTRNCPARSGNFGKDVLVLAIAYDQHPLAGAFSHHEFEPAMGGIDRDERGRTVVIRPRRHRAFPLAEIECGHSVLVQHGQLTELLAGIP